MGQIMCKMLSPITAAPATAAPTTAAPTTAAPTTVAPTTTAQNWYKSASDTSGCPDGYTRVTSLSECQAGLKDQLGNRWGGDWRTPWEFNSDEQSPACTSDLWPSPGCFLNLGDRKLYFSNRPDSRVSKGGT